MQRLGSRVWEMILVLWVALAARVINLQTFPPGIMRDEALNTGISRQILQGDLRLFYWEGFGHEPLYHLLAAPVFWLLDEHYFSIRLPSALLGLLLVAVGNRLGRQAADRLTGTLVGILLALSWWPLILSRVGLRPILEPLLIGLGMLVWRRRPWLAGVFLAAGIYTYTAGRYLWLLPLGMLSGRWLLFKWRASANGLLPAQRHELHQHATVFTVSFTLYLPLAWLLFQAPELQERVQQLQGPLSAAQSGEFGPLFASLWATLRGFLGGGDPAWSYANPEWSILPLWLLPFFWIGLLLTCKRSWRSEYDLRLLLWLLIGLAPTILAPEAPSLVRMVGALPVTLLLVAVGIGWLVERVPLPPIPGWIRSAVMGGILGGLLLVQLSIYAPNWINAPPTRDKFQQIWLEMTQYIEAESVPAQQVVVMDAWYESLRADALRFDVYQPQLMPRWVQQGRGVTFPEGGAVDLFVPEYQPLHPGLNGVLEAVLIEETLIPSDPAFRHLELRPLDGILTAVDSQTLTPANGSQPALRFLNFECQPSAEPNIVCFSIWEVAGPIPSDSTFFMHGVAAGDIMVQEDRFDIAAETHQIGDQFVQIHELPFPRIEPHELTILLGVYQRQNGLRYRDENGAEAVFEYAWP